jgi:hypothetical protein
MHEKQHRVARRGFLAGAGVVAAAAGAAALTSRTATPPAQSASRPEPASEPADDGQGYRVSEHVRKYYRTTLV